jgi:hypothetical protein
MGWPGCKFLLLPAGNLPEGIPSLVNHLAQERGAPINQMQN